MLAVTPHIARSRKFYDQAILAVKSVVIDQITCQAEYQPVAYTFQDQWQTITINIYKPIAYMDMEQAIIPSANLDIDGNYFAKFVNMEFNRGPCTAIYSLHLIAPVKIRVDSEFSRLLESFFIPTMTEYFNINDNYDGEYIAGLFKYFVHDGYNDPQTINDLIVSDGSNNYHREDMPAQFKEAGDFYVDALGIFKQKYENWCPQGDTVTINRAIYKKATIKEVVLENILKEQHILPCVQLLIKQWIVHQFITHSELSSLKKLPFFNVENIDRVIEKLQETINDKIIIFSKMDVAARGKVEKLARAEQFRRMVAYRHAKIKAEQEREEAAAKLHAEKNSGFYNKITKIFTWFGKMVAHQFRSIRVVSANDFYKQITGRISLFKIDAGFKFNYIHLEEYDSRMPFISKLILLIDTYLNIVLIRQFVIMILKNMSQSIWHLHNFAQGSELVLLQTQGMASLSLMTRCKLFIKKLYNQLRYHGKEFIFAIYSALKAVYLLIWLPFISIFFVVAGITSLPLHALKALFGIVFRIMHGGSFDEMLVKLETTKDITLFIGGIILSGYYLVKAGLFVFDPGLLVLGAQFVNFICLIIASPILLLNLREHYYEIFPHWVFLASNRDLSYVVYECPRDVHRWYWSFRAESAFSASLKNISAFSALDFISIHGAVAVCTFGFIFVAAVVAKAIILAKNIFERIIRKNSDAITFEAPVIGVKKIYKPQLTNAELRETTGNLNHSQIFREYLGKLISNNESETEENEILQSLAKCKLNANEKNLFQQYIESQEKNNMMRLELMYLRNLKTYLPSKKLVDQFHLNTAINEREFQCLKEKMNQIYEIYNSPGLEKAF